MQNHGPAVSQKAIILHTFGVQVPIMFKDKVLTIMKL